MRAIYLTFFWGAILLFFWLIPKNFGVIKANEAFYLKEYHLRFLINLKELENNTLVELAKAINSTGCYSSQTSLIVKEIGEIYEFYKKEQFDTVFGVEIFNTTDTTCYYYNSTSKICICFFENFERALNKGETIEVREASTVSLNTDINITIGNSTIILRKIGIGYYKRWMK